MINQVKQDHTCSICLGVYYKPVTLKKCKHMFCQACIEEASDEMERKKCPLCRSPFRQIEVVSQKQLHEELMKEYPQQIELKLKSFGERKKYRVQVGNSTIKRNTGEDNKYQWTLFVQAAEGESPLPNFAEKVQVQLHPTFHPSVITFPATHVVSLRRIGWGTFRIDIKIYWKKEKGGGFTELYHDLCFNQPKKSKVSICKLSKKVND